MNILVIKQTSLGDVLHSTGHIRTIKQNFPDCHLTLLTATSSADIYRHNPWVDEIILFDRYRVKREWWSHPVWTARHISAVMSQVRSRHYDLAFDLQGLAKSVLFLYGARAGKKFVKGNWWRLQGYHNPSLHAIDEMNGVLARARLDIGDTTMEFFTSTTEQQYIDDLLLEINPGNKPLLVFSPFSRWNSKDWPLQHYVEIAVRIAGKYTVAITGAPDLQQRVAKALPQICPPQLVNLAGRLSIPQFAELVGRARLMLTGDSFPMHVACAKNTSVIALFGPTDESKVGPTGAQHQVIRAPDCDRCDRAGCPRYCLGKLPVETVSQALDSRLRDLPD